MKILLDHNIPAQLKFLLTNHLAVTARQMQWDDLENGDLLLAAESAGFDAMITGDQNLTYQQNNAKRTLALIVITQIKRIVVISNYARICEAIDRATPGSYELVVLPRDLKKR